MTPPLLSAARLRRVAGFASVQVVVQALGFLAGVLLVRGMTPAQYGYYTLAIGLVSVGSVLGELGLVTAVLALGGRFADQRPRLRALLDEARRVQARIAVPALFLVAAAFGWLLWRQQAGPVQALLLCALAAGVVVLNVRSGLVQSLLRLEGQLAALQWLDLAVNALRVLLLAALVLLLRDRIDAAWGLLVNLAGALLLAAGVRRWLARWQPAAAAAPLPDADRQGLRDFVRRQAPNSVYYVLSTQLAVWLIGLLGTTEHVAQVGALGRLAAAFALVTAVVSAVVQPYFARTHQADALRQAFVLVNAGFGLLLALLLGLAWAAPGLLLWVLGPHYAGLGPELRWMVAGATLSVWYGALYLIGSGRGWVLPALLGVGTGLCSTALGVLWLDMSTVAGSFQLGTLTAGAQLLVTGGHVAWCLRRQARQARHAPEAQPA